MKALNLLIVLCTALMLMVSCEKEKKSLSIQNVVAENHDGGDTIPIGETISVNFDAIAGEDARLDFYHIEIHDHPESGAIEDEYKIIDDDFKGKSTFSGLRNAHVHEHILVPDTANPGPYHVVIVVVDEDGNSVDTEALETHVVIIEKN